MHVLTNSVLPFSQGAQVEKDILIIPCADDDLEVKATHFCKTCEDPEPLCESCAKQHTRQKIAKNHEISADMATFLTPQKVSRYTCKLLTIFIFNSSKSISFSCVLQTFKYKRFVIHI